MKMPHLFAHAAVPRARASLALLGCITGSLAAGVFDARAATRPGAARVLSIKSAAPAAAASLTQAQSVVLAANTRWSAGGAGGGTSAAAPGVFFVHEEEGRAASIWVALATASGGGRLEGEAVWSGRGLNWSARPALRLRAPWSLTSPLPALGGRVLFFCTNAPTLDDAVREDGERESSGRGGRRGRWRVAWMEGASGRWGFLSPPEADASDPCLSPDGKRLSFTQDRGGRESVVSLVLGSDFPNEAPSAAARLAASEGRGGRWLDSNTLIFESTRTLSDTRARGGARDGGLFVVDMASDGSWGAPRLLLARAREVAVAPNGRALAAVVSASSSEDAGSGRENVRRGRSAAEDSTLLVLAAPDGSGARLLPDTRGARRPAFASDGRALLFDAPASSSGSSGSSSEGRVLWSVPLLRTPPVATLTQVAHPSSLPSAMRSASVFGAALRAGRSGGSDGASSEEALAVVGTAFSPEWGPLSVRIEVGEGESPEQWSLLAERTSAAQNEVLALWKPPSSARGDWTLRLKVRDAAGDEAQSLLPVTLPLLLPFDPAAVSSSTLATPATPTASVAPRVKRSQTITRSIPPRSQPTRSRSGGLPARAPSRGGGVPILPLPALPPAPEGARARATSRTAREVLGAEPNAPTAVRRVDPVVKPSPAPASTSVAEPSESALPEPRLPRVDRAPEDATAPPPPLDSERPTSPAPRRTVRAPGRASQPGRSRDREREVPSTPAETFGGEVDVIGLPAELKAGESVEVTVRWLNRSGQPWNPEEEGGAVTRLAHRFVDRGSGYRRRWKYDWLRAVTPPNERGEQVVRVTAPAAGRYRVTFGLLRIPRANWSPPPANDFLAQRRWPGEVAQAVYAVEVTP